MYGQKEIKGYNICYVKRGPVIGPLFLFNLLFTTNPFLISV